MTTCCWVACQSPAMHAAWFCGDHAAVIAHATTALDAERQEADS